MSMNYWVVRYYLSKGMLGPESIFEEWQSSNLQWVENKKLYSVPLVITNLKLAAVENLFKFSSASPMDFEFWSSKEEVFLAKSRSKNLLKLWKNMILKLDIEFYKIPILEVLQDIFLNFWPNLVCIFCAVFYKPIGQSN